jgi:quercetin dioxygenase-like cupin family protein
MLSAGNPSVLGQLSGLVRGVSLALLATVLIKVGEAEAQRVVMVYEEPRHRLVFEDRDIKLLDVQIQPGDTTLHHTHDSPILYTFISTGPQGSANGRVQTITEYAKEPYTHEVTNPGPHLMRILALAHYGPGEASTAATRPHGLTGEPQIENEWFRSYRLELQPGQTTSLHRHSNTAVIIQVSDGRTEVSKENGFGAELTRNGDWTVREAGSPYTIRNAGSAPVSVVVNEARRGS